MKKSILFVLIQLITVFSYSQVTIRITSIPTNTPVNSTIYFVSSLNNWNPSDTQYIMQPDGFGAFQIVIPQGTGTIEFKFTRGSWTSVEGNSLGGYLPNRSFTFNGSSQVINLTIQSWEDISGSSTNSTATSNVQVLSSNFYMPQLNRYRKVWIYLPPDYFITTKNYPVIYMQDGQNLFDNATSFSGEWQVDETLNNLHSQGDYGAIVVGIDNGGSERLNEYSPWINTQYGGGQGDLYVQFLAETLKPYIDTNFRTRTQSQFNALFGSSMGSFIGTYGAVKYPNIFSKVGVFSPAYWFALNDMNNYITSTSNTISNLRLYFLAGQNESTSMVPNITTIRTSLVNKGVLNSNTFTKIVPNGTHTESFWRSEFAEGYQWLFAQETLSNNNFDIAGFKMFQINNNQIIVEGLVNNTKATIYSLIGQKCMEIELQNGINTINTNLSKGMYILKANNSWIKLML